MIPPSKDGPETLNLTSPDSTNRHEIPSQIHPRQTFRRQSSAQGMDYENVPADDHDGTEQATVRPTSDSFTFGLGLSNIHSMPSGIRRVPVGRRRSPSPLPPPSHTLTPEVSRSGGFSQTSTSWDSPLKSADPMPGDWASANRRSFNPSQKSISQYGSNIDLIDHSRRQDDDCPTEGDVLTNPWSFMTVSILVLSIYSTIFSGVFLGIALAKPRWGERVGVQGRMSYPTATLLSALFSKTVELSFVTVFVALLGQILSRRAFARRSRRSDGISIAEMTMRTWIMQPGSLITHWRTVKYAAATILGVAALLATLAAMLYTTAAEALVAPKLKFGPHQHAVLSGTVATAFANTQFLSQNCDTPVTEIMDPDNSGLTCLQIDYAGQSYHDFSTWLGEWDEFTKSGNATPSSSLTGRPLPFAMLYDNTTVTGQWITPNQENVTKDSELRGRYVENITMAMPHTNIFNAVREPRNHIPQPQDLQGQGEYEISGSLPAPALNVLCVSMTTEELEPLIYNATGDGPRQVMPPTAVDDLFDFGNETWQQPAAQFAKIPIPRNTVHNSSEPWGTNAVYLLATPPDTITTEYHIMCSLKATLYPNCTTKYNASESGGSLSVHCDDDPLNTMEYAQSDNTARAGTIEQNWKDIGSEWIRSTALSHGVNDANASIARLVTQMIPTYSPDTPTTLSPVLPSIAEALGVLAGCTLVMSSDHAPFVHFYNYSDPTLEEPQTQYFNASVRYKDFQSGGNQDWQGMFYVILFAVFGINVFALIYLIKQVFWDGQVTDYTEPENLFAIANLSPPSQSLRGACGGGPRGAMLGKKFRVDMKSPEPDGGGMEYSAHVHGGRERRHPHFYVKCVEDEFEQGGGWERESPEISVRERKRKSARPRSVTAWYEMDQSESPAIEQGGGWERESPEISVRERKRKSARPRSVTAWYEMDQSESPAIEQYRRLAS